MRAPSHVGAEPEGGAIEAQGFGWLSSRKSGKGVDAITSGIEGPWTSNPTHGTWVTWSCCSSMTGSSPSHRRCIYLASVNIADEDMAPEVDGSGNKVTPMMTTADMAMKTDPSYKAICERFLANPEEFGQAFAGAWFKLLHRDMGPKSIMSQATTSTLNIFGKTLPLPVSSCLIQPCPRLRKRSPPADSQQMVETAWASASTFRGSDLRGGANGARIHGATEGLGRK